MRGAPPDADKAMNTKPLPPAHPSSQAAIAPAPPPAGLAMPVPRACMYFATAAILAVAQGFSQSMVSVNTQQLQGVFGATQAETVWLTVAFMAPNASLSLALIKVRGQFGLRRFAEFAIVAFLLSSLLSFAADDFQSNLAVRFLAGCAAAPMTSLGFLYMLDPLPPHRKMNVGLAASLTLIFMGSTVTRLISPHLLALGSWHGLTIFEASLAAVGLGLIYRFPLLAPAQPMRIEAGDVISFLLIFIGFGSLTVVAITGAQYWWTEQAWLGWTLVAGIATLALAAIIELNRKTPLLDIRWLASPGIMHFAASLLFFRLILSEQTAGAAGLLGTLGLQNEQMRGLWLVVLGATILGGVICAVLLKPGREKQFHVVALLLLIGGSLLDARSTWATTPRDMYLSQAMIGMASALFLPPALLSGVMAALAKGSDYILTFIIIFLTTQKLGGFLGGAVFSTFIQSRTILHQQRLGEALVTTDPMVAERIATYASSMFPVLRDSTLRSAQAAAQLAADVRTQASVLAYNDAFLMTAAASTIGLALLLGHSAIDLLKAKHAARSTVVTPPASQGAPVATAA